MSKAAKALPILKKHMDYFELIELINRLSAYLAEESQEMMKETIKP